MNRPSGRRGMQVLWLRDRNSRVQPLARCLTSFGSEDVVTLSYGLSQYVVRPAHTMLEEAGGY